MTVAVFVTVVLTFFLFNIYTIGNTKKYLIKEANTLIDGLKEAEDPEGIAQKFGDKEDKEHFYKFVVFGSKKQIYFHSDNEKINVGKKIDRHLDKAVKNGENFFLGSPYKSGATINYAVRVSNGNFEDGYMILLCSVDVMYNSGAYFIIVALAVIIWVGVILASYFALTLNMKFATIPFEKIEEILVDINNGEYMPSQIPQKLNFPEFKAVLTKIDDLAGEISKNFVNLQYEQKKSSILLQSVNQGIIVVSKSGRIVLNNKVALDIFGKDNDVVGVELSYLIENEELVQTLLQSLESKKYYVGEIQIGEGVYRVETAFNNLEANELISGEVMLVIITNVTLEINSAKIRSEFFANASHELKTPLTAISGYSELMTMDGVSKKQMDKCVDEISVNAKRMRVLIDDMLRLSKLDADLDNEETVKFDMAKLCKDVAKDIQGLADTKKVSIEVEGSGEFIGRKKMIQTLVSNLVNNAIKYNKENGQVLISVAQTDSNLILKVQDNGIGIAKEHQSRLFERFYKVDTSRTYTNESSTGLGLAIVKKIAVIHGGKISVKSEPGKGTEFKVVFPKRIIEC